ncbi:Ctp1 protein [Saccharomycopsis crataegensis]|uniref:Ctp1 protein n=1 Tax=Saccharomycopsis crataegensis TaxID=43959 RepID=A0AAV5QP34_9ASCO|nr:Ctp1 protein [Saccharomycopsis crataegensis]
MSSRNGSKVDPTKSFIAGGVAGAIEGVVTYPFEFTKTRLQLLDKSAPGSRNPIVVIYQVSKHQGVRSLYVGCPAFVVGNTVKASVRFFGFDSIKKLLVDKDGKLSGPRGVVAGMGAGVLESLLAVTPSEAIKTAMIDDKRSPAPKYTQAFGSIKVIKELGLRKIYAGFLPATLRQASNQAVRLGAYNSIKVQIQKFYGLKPNEPLDSGKTFMIGALAGIITVYTTMPIDTVKTRMQALNASDKYSSTVNCFMKVYKDEGLKTFWKGSTPRLGRLFFSGGIVFTIYEKMLQVMG